MSFVSDRKKREEPMKNKRLVNYSPLRRVFGFDNCFLDLSFTLIKIRRKRRRKEKKREIFLKRFDR